MTLLVDLPVWSAHGRLWCHLVSDESFDELHAFAGALGFSPRAFHRDHYDVPVERRDEVVRAGAVQVPSRELVRRIADAGLRRRMPRRSRHGSRQDGAG